MAFAPGKASGSYSKHFDRVVNGADKDDDHYKLTIPGQSRADASAVTLEVPIVLPHEAFGDEVREHPELLQAAVADRE